MMEIAIHLIPFQKYNEKINCSNNQIRIILLDLDIIKYNY